MRVVLDAVSKGRAGAALPPTTVSFARGEATLARAETEQRPTVLGLIASGRMRPDSGTVTFNGRTDYSAMRRHIALIDAPDACEPASDVTVAGLVAEELMFAGRRSDPIAVSRAVDEFGVRRWARTAISNVDPAARVRLQAELAVLRKGVEGIVITSPDRHGGDPLEWWRIAREFAHRGFAVLVVAGDASAAALGASALIERLKETNPITGPIVVTDLATEVAAEVTTHATPRAPVAATTPAGPADPTLDALETPQEPEMPQESETSGAPQAGEAREDLEATENPGIEAPDTPEHPTHPKHLDAVAPDSEAAPHENAPHEAAPE